MVEWPIGLSTGCFYKNSIFECLEAIRNSGFNLIEVCSFPAHLDYHDHALVRQTASFIEDLGMEAYSLHAPFAEHIDITSEDEKVRQKAMEEIYLAVEAARILDVRYLVIHPGPEQTMTSDPQSHIAQLNRAADACSQISERCHDVGIACILENKLPHLQFGNIQDLLWILGTIESKFTGVCLDTGHAYLSRDLTGTIFKLSGHLKMLHASDNNGHYDDHLPPGKGIIDWKNVIATLHACKFCGTIILEIAGHGSFEDILKGARDARQYLRRIAKHLPDFN